MPKSNSTQTAPTIQEASNRTGIYLWTNLVNGKVYVGSAARTFKDRMGTHLNALRKGIHVNKHFQNAWNKYGEENFSYSEVEVCDPEKVLEREQYWLDHYQAADRKYGYNLSPTAGSNKGMKFSKATKEKHRKNMKKYWSDPEKRARMSAVQKISQNRPEVNAKRSASIKKVWTDPEVKARASATHKARCKDPKERARRSEMIKISWQDPNVKKSRSDGIKKTKADPNHRKKMSENTKADWIKNRKQRVASLKANGADPEFRAKMSRIVKESCQRPEVKKNRSAAAKAKWKDPAYRAKMYEATRAAWVRRKTKRQESGK